MNDQPPTASTAETASRSWLGHQLWLLRRRRGFLVNPKWQLRAAALATLPVVLLLILVNLLYYSLRVKEMETVLAIAPSLRESLKGIETSDTIVGVVASSILVVLVFMTAIFETHRTSGAALKIRSKLLEIAEGPYRTGLALREGDNLRELEEPFDRMTEALRERAAADAETLEGLATELESAEGSGAAQSAAAKLRRIAVEIRGRSAQ